MTDTQYERLSKIVSDGTTVQQLKEIITRNKFEVNSTNPNNYAPLKDDYVAAAMSLLTGYNPFTRSFVFHAHYTSNLFSFPATIHDALIKEVV